MGASRGATIGKVVVWIGVFILFLPVLALMQWYGYPWNDYVPQVSDFIVLGWFVILGLIIVSGGFAIHKRFRQQEIFLAKDGEPIHSGEIWKRGHEQGLFVTSCGLVVSTNDESEETAHTGYRRTSVKRATCIQCAHKRGREILDEYNLRREY